MCIFSMMMTLKYSLESFCNLQAITLNLILLLVFFSPASAVPELEELSSHGATREITAPYYFIAVHNEPYHGDPNPEERLKTAYRTLQEMVDYATRYGIHLTLMFTPQWGTMIGTDPEKLAEVHQWEGEGHEIALHHHSIYHGSWDGYTDYPPEYVLEERSQQTKNPEQYLGTLDDMMEELAPLSDDICSGCANDEQDKAVLPNAIRYDTCSGFLNNGQPGTRAGDQSPEKGVNVYIISGTVNGTPHSWLGHQLIGTTPLERQAEDVLKQMDSELVFGAITHSTQEQARSTYQFFEFLHQMDPKGERSVTVREVIENQLLTEVVLPDEVINATYEESRVKGDDRKNTIKAARNRGIKGSNQAFV